MRRLTGGLGFVSLFLLTLVVAVGPRAGFAQTEYAVEATDSLAIPITAWSFVPTDLTVAVGDSVVWTVTGQQVHTVTADDRSWGSEMLVPGQSFAWTFAAEGTYGYFCTPHPWMRGTVTVIASAWADEAADAPADEMIEAEASDPLVDEAIQLDASAEP